MFKSLTAKIISVLVIIGLTFCVTYFAMPEKTIEVEKEKIVEVDKIVETTKYVPYEKIVEIEKIVEVPVVAGDSDELIALREATVEGFINKLEKKIDIFEGKIELIDDAIEVFQDKIDVKNDDITLLYAQINSKEVLINALIVDDPVGNLAQIRSLEDEIIALEEDIDNKQDRIDGWLDDIADLNEDKEPWSDKIALDKKCISEIEQYIQDGSEYSEDVEDRLEVLNLI